MESLNRGRTCLALPKKKTLEELVKSPGMVCTGHDVYRAWHVQGMVWTGHGVDQSKCALC